MPDDRSFSGGAAPKLQREADANLPLTETHQPDPLLQTSTGRMGAGGITVAAVVVAAILGVVLYGLNERRAVESSAAPPSTTAGRQPAAGGPAGPATPAAPRTNESGVKG
jgi:hypothetical protein